MGFKSFRLNVAARVLLLGAVTFVGAWGWSNTTWQATPLVCALLAVLLLVELLRYVESVNRELAGFLQFVAHHDFSVRVPLAEKGAVFRDLEDAYNVLTREYLHLNREKAANHRYLESIVEHVSVALICFDGEGAVRLMNREAQELFKTPHLVSVNSLRKIDPALPGLIKELADGSRALVSVRIADEPLQLALYATEFRLVDETYKLVSFQNIRDELEQREVDYSQKLIRILTHEIMNSVTPILSLTKLLGDRFGGSSAASGERVLTPEERTDLARGVESIQSRGSGLLRFVQAYRSLTNLPRPNVAVVSVAALFQRVHTLLAPTLVPGELVIESEPGLTMRADAQQIEQVLINLVKNAGEALAGRADGRVVLRGSRDERGRLVLQVIDNGPGIPADQVDDIFVPFFTTKKGGSGVGLSVSRQIMVLNRGSLTVKTSPGRGCELTLKFK
jgi:nitrogen fixation/metabolism regulation signal transduction histidine kinase